MNTNKHIQFLYLILIGIFAMLMMDVFKFHHLSADVQKMQEREKWFAPWMVHGKEMTLDKFRESQGWEEIYSASIGEIKPGDSVIIYPDKIVHSIHSNSIVTMRTNLPGDVMRFQNMARSEKKETK
jgi:hypothetical protein